MGVKKESQLLIRVSDKYKAWLQEQAEQINETVADFVRQAVAERAARLERERVRKIASSARKAAQTY